MTEHKSNVPRHGEPRVQHSLVALVRLAGMSLQLEFVYNTL